MPPSFTFPCALGLREALTPTLLLHCPFCCPAPSLAPLPCPFPRAPAAPLSPTLLALVVFAGDIAPVKMANASQVSRSDERDEWDVS